MQQLFPMEQYPFMRYFIGDVRDRDRLDLAMRDVDYVIHAAALKQVPTAEYNPFECIRTNVFGAENVVCAALRRNVRKVIALSTDKAANPVNLYGASKLASDKIFVAANNLAGADGTRFAVVRYGNVFGSRGSVVPFFQQADGRRRRDAADHRRAHDALLDHADAGRELRALQHGDDARRRDLRAQDSLDHHHRSRHADRPQARRSKIVGIRPGEKLHETMIPADDSRWTVELDDRYVILASFAAAAREAYLHRGAKPVAEGFAYSSDTNPEQLDARGLQMLLAQAFA